MSEQDRFEQEQMQGGQPEQTGQDVQTQQDVQTGQDVSTEQTVQTENVEQGVQNDNGIYTTPDVYQTQTAQEIYQTPDMSTEHHNSGGVFSGDRPGDSNNGTPYYQDAYNNDQPANDTCGNGQPENNVYGNGASFENNTYGNVPQPGSNLYGNAPYENNPYGKQSYENNPYGKQPYESGRSGNNAYGNNQYGNNPYGNPYAPDPYGYNPYSPYAAPVQKKNTGLIIGVILGVGALFLIAVVALFYHAIEVASDKRDAEKYEDIDEFYRDYFEDDPDEDYFDDKAHRDDEYYGDDDDKDDSYYDDDYDYDGKDDYYDDDYNYDDDEYYTLHDDIKDDLSYTIDWEYYDYDAGSDNVIISVQYPVIVKGRIPNRDQINDVLESEMRFFVDYYENEYSGYMDDENSYFYASSIAYVTYMSEDVLSIVFSESVYSDYFDSISLYCVNIDIQNGVILDNTDILSVDDNFSVDFRYRSQRQNGSVDALDRMSDQEITQMLTSSGSLIIFYTPQGLEVGLNHEDGYVTVTYHDYKDYLNTF